MKHKSSDKKIERLGGGKIRGLIVNDNTEESIT